ncbi:VIT domain-containing protein [Piscinibacter gummiphilus]|uniref:VIT domain-containing protein n=1 Tax=Piscinibacter gummiphilus TaxID=946333 RepID=A0ABZ0D095_9BURK|nr:VIT domain-containing protein [Piscinibacter gummiphilus]WOB08861.1 VIT domain-containing protein [Piscinibacter gummiphilus]
MATAALTSAPLTRRTCLSALLGAAAAPSALALAPPARPFEPPVLRMRLQDHAAEPVRVQRASVRAEVVGHAAQMRVELVFFNPNGRVLEGELQFPLGHGQWVSGFELDIDGELRPAVVVDKARGQQVFEDVIRARVDPALLEVTEGDNYKLRVYPLPAQGTRRVVLHLAQTLDTVGRLDLPLRFGERLSQLDVQVRVAGVTAEELTVSVQGLSAQALERRPAQQGWAELSLSAQQLQASPSFVVTLPRRSAPVVMTQRHAGRDHFYAELPMDDAALTPAPRAKPRRLALLWDASGSAAQRGRAGELALLDNYFRAIGQAEVLLHVGRDVVEPEQRFTVRGGQWQALRRVLELLPYDGASNLPALIKTEGCDLALLFSDGLSNWGTKGSLPASTVPLYALSFRTDHGNHSARLRQLAERSGGEYLDLTRRADALQALQTRKPRLVRVTSPQARDVVIDDPYAEDGYYRIAGLLTQRDAELTLEFERADGRLERRRVNVSLGDGASTQVAQRWAGLRMAELEAAVGDTRAEVRRLGRAYGLVSRETSLIVLEALNDYVRFEIEPPPSLRSAYERAMAQGVQRKQVAQAQHLDQVAARFAEQVAWWEKDFPKDGAGVKLLQKREQAERQLAGAAGRQEMDSARRDDLPRMAPAAAAPIVAAESRERGPAESTARKAKAGAPGQDAPPAAVIRLQPWQPDVPYARRLRAAPPEAVYRLYLEERPQYLDSTAFFLDAADVLFAKKLPQLAMRVLSNLAEMDLQNRHILRVLGYRLLQAQAPQLAVPVLREVQRLSPHGPQSFRDLGLAHAEAGQWQEAVDQLWQVVSRPWDGRFPDIDLTALNEMNMVIARAERQGRPVKTSGFDRRLLRNLPLDLRIVLGWDADNTDIDLWVTDPDGEQTYYGKRLSYQGARVSRDVTGGYGPEEFALKVAKPGRYRVQARFYGHRQQVVSPATTLMLVLSTGFGRADQKDERVTVRLSGPADMVTVGSFEVGTR